MLVHDVFLIVSDLVFQLQHLVCDDICVQTLDLYLDEKKLNSTGGPVGTAHQRLNPESAYQRKAEQLLAEENCFKIAMVCLLDFLVENGFV